MPCSIVFDSTVMKSLKEHAWKLGGYDSDEVQMSENHVVPMLQRSMRYDRSVGYLKKSHFTDIGLELLQFVERGGRARFLFGDPLEREVLLACERGMSELANETVSEAKLRSVLRDADPQKGHYDLAATLIQYLVATQAADFRLLLRQNGMHHEKVRIAYDHEENCVITVGSENDSNSALSGKNMESGTLVASWGYPGTDYWETHGERHIDRFERFWKGKNDDSITIVLSEQVRLGIQTDWANRQLSYDELKSMLRREATRQAAESLNHEYQPTDTHPAFPESLNGRPYQLMEHQRAALEAWRNLSDYKGIFALCTGAGKTVTALHAATAIAKHHKDTSDPLALVVAVPYQVLAEQWLENMRQFNIEPIQCWGGEDKWRVELESKVSFFHLDPDKPSFLAILVVNKTLRENRFLNEQLQKIDSEYLMFVGDECHHHAKEALSRRIPVARYMVGLSATPWNKGQEQERAILQSIYSRVVSFFGIEEAHALNVLTPYHYEIDVVRLNEDEWPRYVELSRKIAVAMQNPNDPESQKNLDAWRGARARIVGSCEGKFSRFEKIVRSDLEPLTLVYVGDGSTSEEHSSEDPSTSDERRDIERALELLSHSNLIATRFTARETPSQRKRILKNFAEQSVGVVVAIRVLDEGFDLPAVRRAFLLASSRSERQFVQRRGRILRKAKGKDLASVHDFLVFPPAGESGDTATNLVRQELIRAREFFKYSTKASKTTRALGELYESYDIDVSELDAATMSREDYLDG